MPFQETNKIAYLEMCFTDQDMLDLPHSRNGGVLVLGELETFWV